MKTPSPTDTAWQFAKSGLVGASALFAEITVLDHHGGCIVLSLALVLCLIGGGMAGRVLGAGPVGVFAAAVTLGVGGLGAVLARVATQGMARESELGLVWFFAVYYAVAFAVGAAIGFAFAPRHGLPAFVPAVKWFTIGGAVAGAGVGLLAAAHLDDVALSIGVCVAVDAAFAIGGAGVARELGKKGVASPADEAG